MARGRLLKSKIKEAKAISEAISTGSHRAEKKKDFEVSAKEHIGKMIDRIDPLELVAMLGMTLLIHDTYNFSASKLTGLKFQSGQTLLGLTRRGGATGLAEFGELLSNVPDPIIWIVSFIASYYVLRNGKDIVSAVSSTILMLGL